MVQPHIYKRFSLVQLDLHRVYVRHVLLHVVRAWALDEYLNPESWAEISFP